MAMHRGRTKHRVFFRDTPVAVVAAISAHCPDRDLLSGRMSVGFGCQTCISS